MRVSCKLTDPDFWFLHFDRCPAVMLDGVNLEHVVEANEDTGYVTVYDRDARGELKLSGTRVVQKTMQGKVEIVGKRSEKVI